MYLFSSMAKKFKISNFRTKPSKKKYAFDCKGVPSETTWSVMFLQFLIFLLIWKETLSQKCLDPIKVLLRDFSLTAK